MDEAAASDPLPGTAKQTAIEVLGGKENSPFPASGPPQSLLLFTKSLTSQGFLW